MTLVNHETGEIIDTIDADEARRLTDAAQHEFRSSREHFDRAWSLIEQAVEGGGHVALGYRSPGDYLHAEFDGVLAGLDVTERRVAVRTMTNWGLSTRAIAPALGVSNKTVSLDQRTPVTEVTPTAGDMSESDFIEAVSDVDEESFESATQRARADGDVSRSNVAAHIESAPVPVVGIDGKSYSRPKSTAPRRKPITDAAATAGWELRKAVERVERLAADDRFATQKQQMGPHLRAHLENAIEVCQDLLDRINN